MKKLQFIFVCIFIGQIAFGQAVDASFFAKADQFFKQHVNAGQVDYNAAKSNVELQNLVDWIGTADLSASDPSTQKAFYINAYNLLVIHEVTKSYPIASVNEIPGFFDRKKHQVAGEANTLNKLEKEKLLKQTQDERLHFVLVCGAVDCPPIVNFAYQPATLDQQINTQTRLAVNNPNFIKVENNGFALSKIFQWYVADFGGNQQSVLEFINSYRTAKINSNDKITYYEYNWKINDRSLRHSSTDGGSAANESRYVVSAAIPKGSVELKLFNNLYTQQTGTKEALTNRSTFFTSTLSALYGVNNRFNAGLEVKYRRVNNSNLPSSALAVFQAGDDGNSRQGLTGIGPKVRIAPFKSLENFSIQSTLLFPVGQDLAGNSERPYIDWNGPIFNTQLFNDFSIGNSFSLFTEIDFLLEDIGAQAQNHSNRFSTPATVILSYFPNPKTTLYALGGFSPYWQTEFDYFAQAGLGAKYQITPAFELELLFTQFTNKFLLDSGGNAQTFNFGIRYNL